MDSNWNVILLPIEADGKYSVGDTFKAGALAPIKIRKFDGLTIKNIDYAFGVRLHFDWNEWEQNAPKPLELSNLKDIKPKRFKFLY